MGIRQRDKNSSTGRDIIAEFSGHAMVKNSVRVREWLLSNALADPINNVKTEEAIPDRDNHPLI